MDSPAEESPPADARSANYFVSVTSRDAHGTLRLRLPIEMLLIAVILVLTAALRLAGIGKESLWGDEFVAYQHIRSGSLTEFFRLARQSDPTLNPVYFSLCYFWTNYFGGGVIAARMLSVLFGVAAVGVVYAIGRTVSGVLTGAIASVLMAFCVHHIYYSLELRMYAIVWFGASLSSLFLLRAVRAPNRQAWIFANILTNALLLYTHWFTALFIASQALFLLVARAPHSIRRAYWFCAHAVAGIGLGAYLLTVDFAALPNFTVWISPVTWREAAFTPVQLLGLNEFAFGQVELPVTWGEVLLPLPIVLLLVAGTVRVALRNGTRRPMANLDPYGTSARFDDLLYLAIWALLPTVLLALMSVCGMKCYVPRYLGHCTVALIVLIAAAVRGCMVRNRRLTGIAVLLVVFGCYGYRYVTIERPFRTDFATIAGMIRKDIRPDDRILMVPAWQGDILNYYLKIDDSRFSAAHAPSEIVKKLNKLKSPGRSIWMVVVGGGPKRADRNLGYALEALGTTGDTVRPQRIPGYYRAYVLRIPGVPGFDSNAARLGAS